MRKFPTPLIADALYVTVALIWRRDAARPAGETPAFRRVTARLRNRATAGYSST